HALAGGGVAREVVVRGAYAAGSRVVLLAGDDRDLLAGLELDLTSREPGRADLGAAQVLEHGDRAPELDLELAHALEDARVVLLGPVREVEPANVDARLDQLAERDLLRGGGADRGHDLGLADH